MLSPVIKTLSQLCSNQAACARTSHFPGGSGSAFLLHYLQGTVTILDEKIPAYREPSRAEFLLSHPLLRKGWGTRRLC